MSIATAKRLIESLPISAKIVEIAGPTVPFDRPADSPYTEFLAVNHIRLPAKPIITNRTNPYLVHPYGQLPLSVAIDEVVDVRRMPYPASSVDMIICSYLTWYGTDTNGRVEPVRRWLAGLHYRLGYLSSRVNLHISLLRESGRVLRPGGLLLVEGVKAADYIIAQRAGFRVVYRTSRTDPSSSALFVKRKRLL